MISSSFGWTVLYFLSQNTSYRVQQGHFYEVLFFSRNMRKLLLQTSVHHSQREVQEHDDDIEIIADVKKETRSTSVVRPKTTVKKRKKIVEKSSPPMKKISDFFKKQ